MGVGGLEDNFYGLERAKTGQDFRIAASFLLFVFLGKRPASQIRVLGENMRFIVGIFLFAFMWGSAARADWASFRCQAPNESAFLQIAKDADGRVHVETDETRRYLIGLDCNWPSADEPLFYCRGAGDDGLTFSSTWIHERGFTLDSYDRLVDQERLEIYLSFQTKNAQGRTVDQKRTWKFGKADCVETRQ
jgi:hypothetical protein